MTLTALIKQVAESYIDTAQDNLGRGATRQEAIAALCSDFARNASHVGDCFVDTLRLSRQHGVDKDALESGIIKYIEEAIDA
jgi:hypothetical protein